MHLIASRSGHSCGIIIVLWCCNCLFYVCLIQLSSLCSSFFVHFFHSDQSKCSIRMTAFLVTDGRRLVIIREWFFLMYNFDNLGMLEGPLDVLTAKNIFTLILMQRGRFEVLQHICVSISIL